MKCKGTLDIRTDNIYESMAELYIEMQIDTYRDSVFSLHNSLLSGDVCFNQGILDFYGNISTDTILFTATPWKPIYNMNNEINIIIKAIREPSLEYQLISVLPSYGSTFNLAGSGKYINEKPILNGVVNFDLQCDELTELHQDISTGGSLRTKTYYSLDDSLQVNGLVEFNDFVLSSSAFSLLGVGGMLTYDQTILFEPLFLVNDGFSGAAIFGEDQPLILQMKADTSLISIDTLRLNEWDLYDLTAMVDYNNGILHLEHFDVSLFEGNLSGGGWLSINSVKDLDISYHIDANGAELNSSVITGIETDRDDPSSRFSFIMDIYGWNFQPNRNNFNIEGYLHLIKISPKVADNVLVYLDPQQSDKGIQTVKYFLDRGWGIKSFSFQILHGFVYATIITQKPTFSQPLHFVLSRMLPVEKEIKLSRLPVKIFLNK